MRGAGVSTALAGLEEAAVPTGACEPKAAQRAGSSSQPGSLRSLSLPSPPWPLTTQKSARGVEGLKPSPHQTLVSSREPICVAAWEVRANVFRRTDLVGTGGQRVAGRLLCISHGGWPGASAGKRRLRGAALSGGAGCGPGSFTRVPAGSPETWARQEGLTRQVSCSAPFLLWPQPAPGKRRNGTRLPSAAFFTQLDNTLQPNGILVSSNEWDTELPGTRMERSIFLS